MVVNVVAMILFTSLLFCPSPLGRMCPSWFAPVGFICFALLLYHAISKRKDKI